jgi:hypothetical protein
VKKNSRAVTKVPVAGKKVPVEARQFPAPAAQGIRFKPLRQLHKTDVNRLIAGDPWKFAAKFPCGQGSHLPAV